MRRSAAAGLRALWSASRRAIVPVQGNDQLLMAGPDSNRIRISRPVALRADFVAALVCVDRANLANGCLEMPTVRCRASPISSAKSDARWRRTRWRHSNSCRSKPRRAMSFSATATYRTYPSQLTAEAPRILHLTYNRLSDGDHRARYFAKKSARIFLLISSGHRARRIIGV